MKKSNKSLDVVASFNILSGKPTVSVVTKVLLMSAKWKRSQFRLLHLYQESSLEATID
jgi:hypothetical protein